MGYLTLDPYQSGCKLKGAIWTGQLVWKRITGNFQWPLGNVVADVGGDWRPRQGNAWVFSLLISRPEKMKSVRIIVCPQASKYGSRWNQAVYSMRILLHWQFFKIFRFGWQQIQDLAVMERSQKSAMTTNHSLEPRSIGDFTSEGFTLMTRSWRVNMGCIETKKTCFPHPKKTLVTSGGYRMYVHVAIPYLSSRDTWQHTWNVATEVRPWWSRNKVSTLFSVKHIYMYIYNIHSFYPCVKWISMV